MITIPKDASAEWQQALRSLDDRLTKFERNNIDLRGRRIVNAGKSHDQADYLTREEAEELIKGVKPGTVAGSLNTVVATTFAMGLVAGVGATVLYGVTITELYLFSAYICCTTAGAAGTATLQVTWTENGVATTFLYPALNLAFTGYQSGVVVMRPDPATTISFAVAVVGGAGAVYEYFLALERLRK